MAIVDSYTIGKTRISIADDAYIGRSPADIKSTLDRIAQLKGEFAIATAFAESKKKDIIQ